MAEEEATIIGTSESSIHRNGDVLSGYPGGGFPAAKLIDGKSLDGKWAPERGCAHTEGGSMPQWFSVELETSQQVTKVSIVGRAGQTGKPGEGDQGKDVTVTIGQSKGYDANEPLCLPVIPHLEDTWTDYVCTGGPKYGKYVKFSANRNWFTMCEVKIYTNTTAAPPVPTTTSAPGEKSVIVIARHLMVTWRK